MVTVFSAFLQLHAGPTPPLWLHAGHMPSVWTVSKWLHMRSVRPRGSVCRSPLPPNQKQEPARSGPVGGWRSTGRSLTGFHRHSHSFLTNLDLTSRPKICMKGAILTSQLLIYTLVMKHSVDLVRWSLSETSAKGGKETKPEREKTAQCCTMLNFPISTRRSQ